MTRDLSVPTGGGTEENGGCCSRRSIPTGSRPAGPDIDAFEREVAEQAGVGHAVALSSGTAALHLALLLAGVERGDEVLVPSFTFIASAAAATYVGAHAGVRRLLRRQLEPRSRPWSRKS